MHEFKFRRGGLFGVWFTALFVLCTLYFLWRITQAISGQLPWWVAFVAGAGIAYIWYVRLAPVRIITLEPDGSIVFIRGLGRREIQSNELKRVRPWLLVSRSNFVLRHARGWELLFQDPVQVATVVRELKALNPALDVAGVPPLPEGVEKDED